MSLTDHRSLSGFIRRWGAAVILALGLGFLYYAVILRFMTSPENDDYHYHILWALYMQPSDLLSSFTDGSEHLWHVCVRLLYMAGVYNPWKAAGIVTGLADTAACLIVYKAADEAVKKSFPRWILALLAVSVFLVNSITLPGCTLYVNAGAANSWHNPTNIMVRPFAAAVFYMTVRIYNRRRCGLHAVSADILTGEYSLTGRFRTDFSAPVYTKSELILYPLCLLLSAYAKPSFLQCFAPAIFIFLVIDLIRTKGRLFPFCVKLALAYIPAAVVLCSQMSSFFGGLFSTAVLAAEEVTAEAAEESGVVIYFLAESFDGIGGFFRELCASLRTVLTPAAFPLFIFALSFGQKGASNTSLRLGSITLGCGWLEGAFLHETGSRASHGNFLWALQLSAWLLWGAAIARYAQLVREKTAAGRLALWVGTPLLLWHLTCGVCYLVRILTAGIYLI